MTLLQNQIFILLLIIVLGELLGKVRLWNLSLGPSAIIFVALAFGHFGFTVPQGIQTIGLAMFIYAVGLQAGPGFTSSFRSHGIPMAGAVVILAITGALLTWACCHLFGFDAATGAGLFSGAMTSTPALAAAVEVVGSDQAPAAYGVTYGFGVIGMAVFIKLLPRLLRVNVRNQEELLARELAEENPPINYVHIEVSNPNLFGKRLADIFLKSIAPVTITRLLAKGADEPSLVGADTVLHERDRLRVVGRTADLEKIQLYIGKTVDQEITLGKTLSKKSIVVSQQKFAGTTLGFFNFRETFHVQVARITRNGMDFPADANTRLHLGDILHAVGDEMSLQNIGKILGNDVKSTYNIDLLPILVGLLFGLLLGTLTVPLPVVGPLKLGATGGALLAGLLLGAFYQTGPMIWDIPSAGNRLIRDLGLALFMTSVGTSAGVSFVATLQERGLPLLFSGILITLLPVTLVSLIGLRFLRIRFLRLLGVLVGGMTSASGLAAAGTLSATPYAPAAYATVYPVALISKILAVKVLLLILPG